MAFLQHRLQCSMHPHPRLLVLELGISLQLELHSSAFAPVCGTAVYHGMLILSAVPGSQSSGIWTMTVSGPASRSSWVVSVWQSTLVFTGASLAAVSDESLGGPPC